VTGGAGARAESCGELQAPCGGIAAARVIFAGFGAPDEAEKRGGARTWAARRGEMIIWDAHSSVNRSTYQVCGRVAGRHRRAAHRENPKLREGLKLSRPNQAALQH
jgi:hypothetical protein